MDIFPIVHKTNTIYDAVRVLIFLNPDISRMITKEKPSKPKTKPNKTRIAPVKLEIDKDALKKLNLVAVAFSYLEREWFPTDESYEAEFEVVSRAQQVAEELEKLKVPSKTYPADQYFFTNLLVDKPDLVLNLVDTLRGKDALQTSVPAALELANIPYTGAGMQGMVIGNNRNLFKQLLIASDIPTPPYQYITRKNAKIDENTGLPLIVKLNESGGSVGIDNNAVKETIEQAQDQVRELISTYHAPVIVERFIPGDEITAIVLEDAARKHVFLAKKVFRFKPDGKHNFTSLDSYHMKNPYSYTMLQNKEQEEKITSYVEKAFTALQHRDYAKFDIRVDEEDGVPYITDSNPNTAFGPHMGLPLTEILHMYGIPFQDVLASLISKHAKKIQTANH